MGDTQQNVEDEIDLVAIIATLFRIIRKRGVLIISFLVLGILGGIAFFYIFKPTYSTQAVVQTRSIDYLEVKGILRNLNQYLEEKNYNGLAKNLKININDAKLIEEIELYSISKLAEYDKKNSERDSIFVVRVLMKDPKMVNILQTKLFHFLNNNPYIKKVNKSYEKQLKQDLERIQNDIQELDSSKVYLRKQLKNNENQGSLKFINLGDIYEQAIKLYQEEALLKQKLLLGQEVSVIENFGEYNKPLTGLGTTIGIAVGLALLLVILLIMFLEINIAVKKHEQNKVNP